MFEVVFTAGFILDLVDSTIRMATPLIYAGLACMISERSGVLNIGIEGMMLAGAFFAAVAASFTGSAWAGLGIAIFVGALFGLLLAFLAVSLGADQVVSGIMINIFALGITGFLARVVMGTDLVRKLPGLGKWQLPVLHKIPYLGDVLFNLESLTFISFALVILFVFLLFKTSWGLSIRAVGEHPGAVDTAGISVTGLRYLCIIISGSIAAMGGAFLSVGIVRFFSENMTAGRGFIGLIIVILAKWHPAGVLMGALFFGFVDAAQLRIQAFGVGNAYHFLIMLPYICGLIAVSGVVGKAHAPAALCLVYRKE